MSLTKFLQKTNKSHFNRICMLKPVETELRTILLDNGTNHIGRNKSTGIRDEKCSKEQLVLNVNMKNCEIDLEVVGVNPSSLNGFMLMKGTKSVALHGDVLEIVYGRHAFEIIFKPPPPAEKPTFPGGDDEPILPFEYSTDRWEVIDNGKLVIFTTKKVKASKKIAAFDMDGTIITTKSGNAFPKNTTDWQILHDDIPPKLKKLIEDGYKICFFTNQAGIASGKIKLNDFKRKIMNIVTKLNIPIQVFIAVGDGFYRKPTPGMWNYLTANKNEGVSIDLADSFYVGDAAGRDAVGKRKRDHSCCDRLFALNVGLKFFTPEEYFFNKQPLKWTMPEFDPLNLQMDLPHIDPATTQIPSSAPCELIILVGLPGSGKSVFAQKTLAPLGYTIFSADTLGSTQNCAKRCEQALQAQKNSVIDNTNVDVESRKKFIEIAKQLNIPCRCFVMNVTLGQIQHNIAFRQLTDTTHSKINQMVLNTIKKKYKAPTLSEGFVEIANVNPKYEFQSKKDEKLYKMYLVEK